jgi:hypothetical protein
MDISTGCVAGCKGVGEMGVFVAINSLSSVRCTTETSESEH